MTRLLLDTNVVVPLARRQIATLPNSIREALRATDHALLTSVVSLWEVAIKHRLGRLPLLGSLADVIGLLDRYGVALLDLTPSQALSQAEPEPPTRDPFDRLLLGICAVEKLRLLTTDLALADHPLAWRTRG